MDLIQTAWLPHGLGKRFASMLFGTLVLESTGRRGTADLAHCVIVATNPVSDQSLLWDY
jgi:hypothetical protein